ncbi:MAG: winged helix-turn-helix transcriptional regulator [Clostridiales bacterium]|nr:winged helix-turn-helix transcriptional regulator [Clostridiales bacterium]
MSLKKTFQALSDPTRREILSLLRERPLAAGDIAARFDLKAATISHHLGILRSAGLVSDERSGKNVIYELNLSVMEEIINWIKTLSGGIDT